jgi:hypothetical protein
MHQNQQFSGGGCWLRRVDFPGVATAFSSGKPPLFGIAAPVGMKNAVKHGLLLLLAGRLRRGQKVLHPQIFAQYFRDLQALGSIYSGWRDQIEWDFVREFDLPRGRLFV